MHRVLSGPWEGSTVCSISPAWTMTRRERESRKGKGEETGRVFPHDLVLLFSSDLIVSLPLNRI